MAGTVYYFGPASGPDGTNAWPEFWTPVPSLNDGGDAGIKGKLDFVGDAQNPGFYMAESASYLFFRMRVAVASAPLGTFTDAHMVLIDVVGWNYPGIGQEGKPDFAFSWDSKSNDSTAHGLEFQIPSTLGGTWGGIRMADADDSSSQKKAPPDINTTGDGFVRTVDNQTSDSLGGATTFIDFAISKTFIEAQAPEILDYDVRIQLGSIANATDHNLLNADIAGGFSTTSVVNTSWSTTTAIPEPSSLYLLGMSLMGGAFWMKRRSSRAS